MENLRDIVLLFTHNGRGFRGSFGSLFGNLRLGGFRELIQLAGNKPVIVGLAAPGQPTDHGQEGGSGGGSGKQFPGEVGQIEGVTRSSNRVRHTLPSFHC